MSHRERGLEQIPPVTPQKEPLCCQLGPGLQAPTTTRQHISVVEAPCSVVRCDSCTSKLMPTCLKSLAFVFPQLVILLSEVGQHGEGKGWGRIPGKAWEGLPFGALPELWLDPLGRPHVLIGFCGICKQYSNCSQL